MHPHEKLLHTFYSSFQQHDGAGMAACYHPNVIFSDPVFPRLEGAQASAMWQMFCARAGASQLQITFGDIHADDRSGRAHWEARYLFSSAARPVHNQIDATFTFADGKIIRHVDSFDFWRWARMALGPMGQLLGWTPFIQNTVRKNGAAGLAAFIAKQAAHE